MIICVAIIWPPTKACKTNISFMKFSIITVCYNNKGGLKKSLRALFLKPIRIMSLSLLTAVMRIELKNYLSNTMTI